MENITVRRASEDFAIQLEVVATNLDKIQNENYSLGDATAAWLDVLARFPGMFFLSCVALCVPIPLRRQVPASTQSGPRPFQICDGRSSFLGSVPLVLPVHLPPH